jgi:hypothetical protein
MSVKDCVIFDKLIIDDLYPYDIHNNQILWYNEQTTSSIGQSTILLKQAALNTTIGSANITTENVWYPVVTQNYSEYDYISDYGTRFLNKRLGIDSFLTIENPKLKSLNTNGKLSTDWLLNNYSFPYRPILGILCWALKRPAIDKTPRTIENFPVGSRLTLNNSCNVVYIKLDNDRLFIETNTGYNFINNQWTFQDSEKYIINVADLSPSVGSTAVAPPKFTIAECYSSVSKINTVLTHNVIPTYDLWISDGECFLYDDSSQGLNLPISSNLCMSYVSGSLYNAYTNIYRMLTLDLPRKVFPKNISLARKYKNLAKILSSSPFIKQSDIYNLDDSQIQDIVKSTQNNPASLISAVATIGSILQTKSGRNNSSESWQSSDIIGTTTQLCKKMLQKYGGDLIGTGTTFISTKNDVLDINNYGFAIQQAAEIYSKNTKPFGIQKITYDGNLIIEPRFTDSRSSISINFAGKESALDNEEPIPLFNKVRPPFRAFNDNFFISPSLVYKGNVAALYMNDGRIFNPETTGNRQDHIYYAQLDIDPNTIIDSPFSAQAGLLNIELQTLFTDFTSLNLYTDTPMFNADDFISGKCQFSWRKISGPDGYFSRPDDKRSSGSEDDGIMPVRGVTNNVLFKTSFTGSFVFECEVTCPIGIFKLKKSVYVVDGRQRFPADNNSFVPNIAYGRYWEPDLKQWLLPPSQPNISLNFVPLPALNTNADIFMFNNIAIDHNSGVFFPVQTNGMVMEQMGTTNNMPNDQIFSLATSYVFKYRKANLKYSFKNKSTLLINYITNSDTYFRINKIILSKIRSKLPNCQNCTSLYQPNLRSRKKTFVLPGGQITEAVDDRDSLIIERTNKHPSQFILIDYRLSEQLLPKLQDRKRINYPKISTINAPDIKTYGGYSRNVINDLGIAFDIEGVIKPSPALDKNNPLAAADSPILPTISGHKLDYANDKDSSSYKICYQKLKNLEGPGGATIAFTKGVLDPNLGWIGYNKPDYPARANRSAVLKFNPGARDTFSFIGPTFREIDKGITNNNTNNSIVPTEYSSSIVLGISEHIQWDPICSCKAEPGAAVKNYQDNILHKDYVDIKYNTTYFSNSNHGYRILAGGEPKDIERTAVNSGPIINDEFDTKQSENVFTYKFAVTGPHNLVTKTRIPRVNNFSIKDIEIKLNFLNYVNMQDVIILLEVEYDGKENEKRFNDKNQTSPIFPQTNYFVNQQVNSNIVGQAGISDIVSLLHLPLLYREKLITDSKPKWKSLFENVARLVGANDTDAGLKKYLDSLTKMNTLPIQNKISLVLWNQQHLQNNTANISLKFSDHSPINNVSCDNNIYQSISSNDVPISYNLNDYQQKQHIILDNDTIYPTHHSMNFSDRQSCFYGHIIKNNRLYLVNNSLSKFVSESMFRDPAPEFGPCQEGGPKQQGDDYNGTTKFTLKFIVMDEPDIMYPYDNTFLGNYHNGLETTENKTKSTQLFNSLCNWELILHTTNTRKRPPYTTHNLSSYGNGDVLSLLDYNRSLAYPGYSYIADLSRYKHFLPVINYNAPYNIIQDSTTCLTGIDDPTGQGIMIRSPDFPSWAIVAIMASLAAYGGLTGGTAVGAVAALPSAINNPAYQAIFDWFTATAIVDNLQDQGRQIFAPLYHKYPFGSPEKILVNFRKPGQLWYTTEAFISKYHNTPILQNTIYNFIKINNTNTLFDFEVVNSYEELIDNKFIVKIDNKNSCGAPIQYKPEYEGHIIQYENFNSEECPEKNNIYYIYNNGTEHILRKKTETSNVENFSNMIYAYHYMIINSIANLSDSADDNHIFKSYTDITSKKIIKIKGRLLYDVLRKNDSINIEFAVNQNTNNQKNNIQNISLIYFDNNYYTIILLNNPVHANTTSKISIDSSVNVLFAFKPGSTHYDTKNVKPNNKWGIVDHEFKHNYYTNIDKTIRPKGSYGDGSIFVNKNLLSNNQINNNINNIAEVLNNRMNPRVKMDTVLIRNNSGQVLNKDYNGSYSGFSYSLSEIGAINNVFLTEKQDKKQILPDTKNLTLEQQTALSIALSSTYNIELFFIRIEQPLSLGVDGGILELITDQTEIVPEKDLTTAQVKTLSDRFKLISNTKTNVSLEKSVGNTAATSIILNSNNIKYINQHFRELKSDDPNKSITYGKLNSLISEKNKIIELLNTKTTKRISVTVKENNQNTNISGELVAEGVDDYVIKTSQKVELVNKADIVTDKLGGPLVTLSDIVKADNPNDKILPKYGYEIIQNADTSLSIDYKKINTEHYWINLDPKQSCVKDFASNPKILVSTTYACVPSSRLAVRSQTLDNNVCPEFLTKGDKAPSQSDPLVEENFVLENTKFDTDTFINGYTYKIKENIINAKKQKYMSQFSDILDWKMITKDRYFNINGDEIIGQLEDVNADVTVRSTEKYLVPVSIQDMPESGAQSDLSADNIEVPGIDRCQGLRTHEGSPSGKGLIGLVGGESKRVGGPTRIENIVNLDNQNDIEVNFKIIPRGLRPGDVLSTIYRYGPKDIYRPITSSDPKVPYEVDFLNQNGTINNSLYEWVAMQVDPKSKTLEYTDLPDFFKHQNEMFFRGLYGSIDEIEHKTEAVKSQYPFEMIPFEYE